MEFLKTYFGIKKGLEFGYSADNDKDEISYRLGMGMMGIMV